MTNQMKGKVVKMTKGLTTNDEVIKNERGVNEMINQVKEKKLIGQTNKNKDGKRFVDTLIYYDLIEDFKSKVFDIAISIINNCYLDISNPLDGLDSIITDLPEYQYFYNEVLDREGKLDLEERVMEDLAYELKYNEDYVIGYDDDKPKIILDEGYYNKNRADYEVECYEDYEFITARKRLLDGEYVLELLNSDSYRDLIDELYVEVFEIAIIAINGCYLETTSMLDALDSLMTYLPEYQDFYSEVINKDAKIDLGEALMEYLATELKYKEGYIIWYEGEKPIIIDARYYDLNCGDYEDEC